MFKFNLRSGSRDGAPSRTLRPVRLSRYGPPQYLHSTIVPQYQPAPHPSHASINSQIEAATATLDSIEPIMGTLKPTTTFEIGVCNAVLVLTGQLKDIKLAQLQLRDSTEGTFSQFNNPMLDMTRVVVKGEQYNRRDALTVVGDQVSESALARLRLSLPLRAPKGGKVSFWSKASFSSVRTRSAEERQTKSGKSARKVAEQLSLPGDFTAGHRKGKESSSVRGKIISPSVTVKFSVISKKETIVIMTFFAYFGANRTLKFLKVGMFYSKSCLEVSLRWKHYYILQDKARNFTIMEFLPKLEKLYIAFRQLSKMIFTVQLRGRFSAIMYI